jgi:hypothetical protein
MHDQWAVHETEFERMIQVAQYGNEKDFIVKTRGINWELVQQKVFVSLFFFKKNEIDPAGSI